MTWSNHRAAPDKNRRITKILKFLEEESDKAIKEAKEWFIAVRQLEEKEVLQEIEENIYRAFYEENNALLHLAKPQKRIWIEVNRSLVRREYKSDAKSLLPPLKAYFGDNTILVYVPGTDLKIHEVLIWDINRKPKLACSCDNFRLFGNIRTMGTCRHTRIVLYWLAGSLEKFWERKVYSGDKRDIEFTRVRYTRLWELYNNIKKDLENRRYVKERGGSLWRLSLTNLFVGAMMSNRWLQDLLEDVYAFKEWLREKRRYLQELEKGLLQSGLIKAKVTRKIRKNRNDE